MESVISDSTIPAIGAGTVAHNERASVPPPPPPGGLAAGEGSLPDRITSDAEYNAFKRELDAMGDAFAANDMANYDNDRFTAIVRLMKAYSPPFDPATDKPAYIIQSKEEYLALVEEFGTLLHSDLGTPEAARSKYLHSIIHEYERRTYSFFQPDPVDRIKERMDAMGLRQKDLVPMLGSRSRVSEVLHRKRRLTLKMIKSLHKGLQIPLEQLMPDDD